MRRPSMIISVKARVVLPQRGQGIRGAAAKSMDSSDSPHFTQMVPEQVMSFDPNEISTSNLRLKAN
ncbi:hypothetical protein CKO12_01520 [Chromatium okenii]|nr:hypothetical protein [Chromatium okenii]